MGAFVFVFALSWSRHKGRAGLTEEDSCITKQAYSLQRGLRASMRLGLRVYSISRIDIFIALLARPVLCNRHGRGFSSSRLVLRREPPRHLDWRRIALPHERVPVAPRPGSRVIHAREAQAGRLIVALAPADDDGGLVDAIRQRDAQVADPAWAADAARLLVAFTDLDLGNLTYANVPGLAGGQFDPAVIAVVAGGGMLASRPTRRGTTSSLPWARASEASSRRSPEATTRGNQRSQLRFRRRPRRSIIRGPTGATCRGATHLPDSRVPYEKMKQA
jgi:hypothetical protein